MGNNKQLVSSSCDLQLEMFIGSIIFALRLIGQNLERQAVVIYAKWRLYVIFQFSTMFLDCFPLCHKIGDIRTVRMQLIADSWICYFFIWKWKMLYNEEYLYYGIDVI